ncbi:MAG TPA: RDD family protein [Bryobacteraceae bacterium]|nr:RDD family protein [Bryobacteraceae bacterium]
MTWYYADAGRQVGPVEETALDDLVRAGVVRDDTLVWREGMATWQPHSAVRGLRPPPPPPAAMPVAADSGYCSECGRPFPMSQLVGIGNASVCAACKPVYLQRMREGGQGIGAWRYGGFWIRFVARIIDAVILAVALLVINVPIEMMLGLGSRMSNPAGLAGVIGMFGVLYLVNFALQCAYEVYFLSTRGATPGKMVLGLKVVRTDGSLLTPGQAVGRFFAFILDGFTLLIGFIIAGFDEQKRALHDRICNTRVIYAK